jgi:tRNA (guanine6-N2)-methyltransferase
MDYEAEIPEGLLPIASNELANLIGKNGSIGKSHRPDSLAFRYEGNFRDLLQLRKVLAVYRLLRFDVPRPKALLGHQHFQRIIEASQAILENGEFRSIIINAAGSDSSVMLRLKEELAKSLQLVPKEDEGDLVLRIRRTPKAQTWDVLIRLSPRPQASRAWRVCNYQGALNASVASVMISLTNPTPQDTFLNIGCGSGTILIERVLETSAEALVGIDMAGDALDCARQNIAAAGCGNIQLLEGDATRLPLADASVNVLAADLPFGYLQGSHADNQRLYPAILREAARVAKQGARFVIISHEVKLMEQCLKANLNWSTLSVQMVTLTGLHPRIFLLERR